MRLLLPSSLTFLGLALAISGASRAIAAPKGPLVPGTGTKMVQVGDDFEDPDWAYNFQHPKSSEDIDKQERTPGGESKNGRWYEGIKRGDPDVVRRVETPPDGLPGSEGSLLLRSLNTGIPGRPGYKMHQDDFCANVHYRLGGNIPVSQQPSVVTRVWVPPFHMWEKRTGPTFGFRVAVDAIGWGEPEEGGRKFYGRHTYWPGMFINFESRADGGAKQDGAYIRIRANQYGGDYIGPRIKESGWWTLGMSFTPDGQIHYFAKQGVEDLTPEDRLGSEYPYGYRCERFKTFFFNVCSADDGRRWSTPWVIDDPAMYFVETAPLMSSRPKEQGQPTRP
jgi:hypothetical protein